jgi:hypothetical protein
MSRFAYTQMAAFLDQVAADYINAGKLPKALTAIEHANLCWERAAPVRCTMDTHRCATHDGRRILLDGSVA